MEGFYAKDYLDRARRIKAADKEAALLDQCRGTLAGGAIGAMGGLIYGSAKGYNLVFCAFLGSMIGGAFSRAYVSIKKTAQ